jgi:hypothetical protein
MTTQERQLEAAATAFLQKAGYTPTGRRRREVDGRQCGFESRLISTPSGGRSGWRR